MDGRSYRVMEDYMLSCMGDSAHDKEHVYRVLYNAMIIAKSEGGADHDVLIAACLLHDIGRKEQFADPACCHAEVGAQKAYRFLIDQGYPEAYAQQVSQCILTHRFRKNRPPESLEAKILFDADKLDVVGAMGIARTLLYNGTLSEPLYSLRPDGSVSTGEGDTASSFFQEYRFKLEKLYDHFYTESASKMAQDRRRIAADFYECLYREASSAYEEGREALEQAVHK